MASAPPRSLHSFISPSTCFTIACVAVSVFALFMAGRRQSDEPRAKNPTPTTAPRPQRRLVADDAVHVQPQSMDNVKAAVQSSPSDVLAELLGQLDTLMDLVAKRMDVDQAANALATTQMLREISLTMAAASHLHPMLGRFSQVIATRPDFFALISATLTSLGSTITSVEEDLNQLRTGDAALFEVHTERLSSNRLALQFLSNNVAGVVTAPPTPPPEALVGLNLKQHKPMPSNTNDFRLTLPPTSPGTDVKNWIEPPPEYSPSSNVEVHEKVDPTMLRSSSPSSSARVSLEASDESSMYEAVSASDCDLLQQLLDDGGNPNATVGDLQRTPLHLAAHLNLCSCLQMLLRNGADMTIEDCKGDMPLHLAAWAGNVEALDILLAHGANVDSLSGRDGYSPLWCAIDASQIDAARLLLKHGARVSSRASSGDGRLPLHQAAIMGQSAMCELLLERGARFDPMDDAQNTPLHYAAASGSTSTVKALLRAGASVHIRQSQGLTPLHWAAHKGHSSVATALLDYGANVDATTNEGVVPLHLAANAGHRQIVRVLLARRADCTKEATCWDGNHGTPLEMALAKGHKTIASLLRA